MLSLTHLLLITVVLLLLFGKTKLPQLGSTFGKSIRNFKKALKGEEEIDVTDSVKQLKSDED